MKKILFLSYRLPDPSFRDGFSIRILNLAKILKKKFKVDLASLGEREKISPSLFNFFDEIIVFKKGKALKIAGTFKNLFGFLPLQEGFYFSSDFWRWVKENSFKYDLLFCETLRTALYAIEIKKPKVIDFIESLSLKYKRAQKYVPFFWKAIYSIEIPRLIRREKELIQSFDKIFVSSFPDKKFIAKNSSKIEILPNGVKEILLNENFSSKKEKEIISFFGKMNYLPNEDAVLFFSKKIFPILKEKFPSLKFYIIGSFPTKKIKKLQKDSSIVVTGYLKNPYTLLSQSKVVLGTLRFGAGIQNKVLEAMALGKALVVSPIVASGIEKARERKHFLVEDPMNISSLLKAFEFLLKNPKKRKEMGEKARKLVKENYTWQKVEEKIFKILDSLL